MEINYVKCGDYYIPALTVPEKRYNIGKYGMLRRTFLQEHHNTIIRGRRPYLLWTTEHPITTLL